MSANQAEFNEALNRFLDKARREATKRVRRAGLEALREIVVRTPVRTGCCRANWRVDFGELSRDFDPNARGNGAVSKCSARIVSAAFGQDFFISNSTPYVVPLEYGYSKQSPAGMVRVTADTIKKLIERGAL